LLVFRVAPQNISVDRLEIIDIRYSYWYTILINNSNNNTIFVQLQWWLIFIQMQVVENLHCFCCENLNEGLFKQITLNSFIQVYLDRSAAPSDNLNTSRNDQKIISTWIKSVRRRTATWNRHSLPWINECMKLIFIQLFKLWCMVIQQFGQIIIMDIVCVFIDPTKFEWINQLCLIYLNSQTNDLELFKLSQSKLGHKLCSK